MRLKEWIVGLMPVAACKKPGSRLKREKGSRME
jgi:hypothetical protein